MNQVFRNPEFEVRWCGGGLLLRSRGTTLLLDCPVGVEYYLGELAGELDAVVLTSGRLRAVGGLIGLLESVSRYKRNGKLTVYCGVGEERGPALVECWMRDWRMDLDVQLDLSTPGRFLPIGEANLLMESVPHSEPLWSQDRVVPAFGVALRVEIGASALTWVPGAGPHPVIGRLCRCSSLAVIEIAGLPWPVTDPARRLTREEALEAGALADELWLVTDAGVRAGAGQA